MRANKTNRATGETAAKVLLFDIESSPNIAYVWGKYEQSVLGDFIKERQIISFAWKWLGESEVHVRALPDFPGYRRDPDNNKALIVELHKLISKAFIAIGHNIDGFDDRRGNTDFIKHGLPPPPPHKTVDTLKVARAKFQFNSNKLGDLGAFLKLGKKVKHGGFELWKRCLDGDMKAWALMKRYNKGDVALLEKIYLKLRPWMTNHPNMNAVDRNDGCPICRSRRIRINGKNINKWGTSTRFRCQENNCGKTFSGKLVKSEWRFQ